jgi:hypothetical protein
MDKIISLYEEFIKKMENEYRGLIVNTPDWKLNSYLPNVLHHVGKQEKLKFALENFLMKDKIYTMAIQDLKLLKEGNPINLSVVGALKMLNIDDRMLEGMGYRANDKKAIHEFEGSIRNVIKPFGN